MDIDKLKEIFSDDIHELLYIIQQLLEENEKLKYQLQICKTELYILRKNKEE